MNSENKVIENNSVPKVHEVTIPKQYLLLANLREFRNTGIHVPKTVTKGFYELIILQV